MQDWKQTRKDINTRLVELNGLSPETMKGMAALGAAGGKTNHLDA
ncbi:carboxymuconolactone decarboxylase family protein, partial [Salmonella enterica subsp. enterica serovar Enteritidis]|nr:carboxymuconolactone decarboxylase family protein [Salmonella enterica subsp. enterica serovar Enteritidis]